ncbi:RNA-directed DNA polymerase [Agrobacterium pusense]|uniref:RNA-directed DNA polymerase n=1 Tax=Agrobacterium pusense TaxID=648995 RepID=UPI002898770A|nr:RNA-directed DNA polymerase [Agrobacterium pusense]
MPATDIQKALLSKGYFPKELPPTFTTADFGALSIEILGDWRTAKVFSTNEKVGKTASKKKRRDAYTYDVDSAEAEIITKPKRSYERRNIHITHPVPQALLAYELSQNWAAVQKWLSKQTYSADEIRVSENFDRSIKGINFPLHRAKKAYLEATSDWLVKTDITRFYPSIYTHSIPWAAYGKERVKSAMSSYKGSLADRLDVLVRACNRNQTIGIPIGPETSRILAEIISARIDVDFHAKCPSIGFGSVDRLQDDWNIGVETLERAENVLSVITTIYRAYGLDINGSKTSVQRIIASQQSAWTSEIGAFLSHRRGGLSGARLREFLNLCLRLQAEFASDPVINYALSVIESSTVQPSDIESMESFLLKSAVVAPNSIERICRILLNLQHVTNKVSGRRIVDRFLILAERNLENGHLYEAIWLLHTIRGLKRPVSSKRICDLAENTPSSALALILLDINSKGLGFAGLPKARWEAQISEESVLTDWTWLLGYEGFRHGWLSDTKSLMATPFFKPMADRNVVFYDDKKNIPSSRSTVAKRQRVRQRENAEIRLMWKLVRGFDAGEY